jgi:hypothetical protein
MICPCHCVYISFRAGKLDSKILCFDNPSTYCNIYSARSRSDIAAFHTQLMQPQPPQKVQQPSPRSCPHASQVPFDERQQRHYLDDLLAIFLEPQHRDFPRAIAELNRGRKSTHWIWWVFPQMLPSARCQSRGVSQRSFEYRVQSREMAAAYLKHPVLARHYILGVNVVAMQLMGMNSVALSLRRSKQQDGSSSSMAPSKLGSQPHSHPACGAVQLMGSLVDVEKLYMSLSTFVLAMHDDPTLRGIVLDAMDAISRSSCDDGRLISVRETQTWVTVVDVALFECLLSLSLAASMSSPLGKGVIPDPFHDAAAVEHVIRTQLMVASLGTAVSTAPDVSARAAHIGVREAWIAAGGAAP